MIVLTLPRDNLDTTCKFFKERRIVLHLTQKDAAMQSGVNLQTLRRFEQSGDISFLNLLKLMSIYGMDKRFIDSITDRKWWTLEQLETADKRKRVR
jgi:transcriptional regulator with XRE-family HTH domain